MGEAIQEILLVTQGIAKDLPELELPRLQEEAIDHVEGQGGVIHQIGEQPQLQIAFLVPTVILLALLKPD